MRRDSSFWLARFGMALFAVVFAAGLVGCSSLPDEELYPVDISLETIETNMQKALDPDGRYAKAKSYFQRQTSVTENWLEETTDESLTDVWFLAPDKLKMVKYVDNRPQSGVIIDGDRGWQCDYSARRTSELSPERMKLVKTLILIANPGSSLSKVFDHISISGCIMDEVDYYRLSCSVKETQEESMTFYIYIDKKDFLIHAYRIGDTLATIVRYGMHEGVRIPVEFRTVNGGDTTRSRVVDYRFDVPVQESEFLPPVYPR